MQQNANKRSASAKMADEHSIQSLAALAQSMMVVEEL